MGIDLRHVGASVLFGRDCPRPTQHVAAQAARGALKRPPAASTRSARTLDSENDVVSLVDRQAHATAFPHGLAKTILGVSFAQTAQKERDHVRVETLAPVVLPDDRSRFRSAVAPQEPHKFDARLRLQVADRSEVLPFRMIEPEEPHVPIARAGIVTETHRVLPR